MTSSDRSPDWVWIWIWPRAASTVTVSLMLPTSSTKVPTLALAAVLKMTLLFSLFLKPASSTITEYLPGGSWGTTNTPSLSVTTVAVTLVAESATVTLAPGMTSPLLSFTDPVIVPALVCASAAPMGSTKAAIASIQNSPSRLPHLMESSSHHCCNESPPISEAGLTQTRRRWACVTRSERARRATD